MGLFYRSMIKSIKEDFKNSKETSLENFLKNNEKKLQEKWELGDLLFYLNITELLEEENVESEYFNKKFKEASAEDAKFGTEDFKKR